jgi:hypothetical protein
MAKAKVMNTEVWKGDFAKILSQVTSGASLEECQLYTL